MERSSTPKQEIALELKDVSYSYKGQGAEALRGLSFAVPKGVLLGILGPNGSGKSTCFKAITTQVQPSSGSVRVFSHSLMDDPKRVRQELGVCFQSPSLDPILSVEENLRVHAALVGISKAGHRIEKILKEFSVFDRRNDRVSTLSGGLARRVELAKSMLHEPSLLLLDEPTVGLDPKARGEFWQLLKGLQSRGTTIVVTTHLMDEAERCDELLFMSKGRCVAEGKPRQLRESFLKEYVYFRLRSERKAEALQEKLNSGSRLSFEDGRFKVETKDPSVVIDWLRQDLGEELLSLEWDQATLADVYRDKTGEELQ